MFEFLSNHKENITFTLFVACFILGIKNINFMYMSMFFVVLYFLIRRGYQGIMFSLFLMGFGAVAAFLFDHFGDKGKYFIIISGLLSMLIIFYKRYKQGKSFWYQEEDW